MEDQCAQIFSGNPPHFFSVSVSHVPLDIIAELISYQDDTLVDHMLSTMGEILMALCIERCRLYIDSSERHKTLYTMEFVKETMRQRVPGSQDKTWDDEFDDCPGRLWNIHDHSGAPVLQQKMEKIPDESEQSKRVCGENLDWNSRVIVMDLFVLLSDKKVENRKIKLLETVVNGILPDSMIFKRVHPSSNWSLGLRLFWANFWLPAFDNFTAVFKESSSDPKVRIAAIGELCHVLGITCRTQWMNTGFSFNASQSPQTETDTIRCRYEQLLDLLEMEHVSHFVKDMREVYGWLKSVYLKTPAIISSSQVPVSAKSKCFLVDCDNKINLSLDKGIHQDNDPRQKMNVHLLALLDLS